MTKKQQKGSMLEQGLLQALQAIDAQIAREMQRTPEERELHGVQKWEPMAKRVEQIAGVVLDGLGDEVIRLESLLVMTQALSKAMYLASEDMGAAGLGKVRTGYCIGAAEAIRHDATRVLDGLRDERVVV